MPLAALENIRLYDEEHGRGPALVLAHGHACGVRSRTIPDATHHVLPGAGHLANLETPDALNRLLAEFLDAHLTRVS